MDQRSLYAYTSTSTYLLHTVQLKIFAGQISPNPPTLALLVKNGIDFYNVTQDKKIRWIKIFPLEQGAEKAKISGNTVQSYF